MRASSEILLLKSIFLNTLSDSALSSSQVPLSPEHSSTGGKGDEDENEKSMRRECKKRRRGAEEGRGEGEEEQGKEEREQGKEEEE